MPEAVLTLLKGDKVTKNVDYGDAIPTNVSGIVQPILGSSGFMLQEPGLTHYAEGVGVDRGGVWNERMGKHFRVSGNSLISISKTGAVTDLGDLPGTDNVSLPYSFISQGIIAGGGFFLWNGDVLTQVGTGASADTGFAIGVPIDGVWVDGYYFLTDGEYLYHTQLADESAINPLAFATSEYSPDPTIGLGLTNDNKVIAFNRFSVEYFVNQATENFAFTRLPSRTIKYGLVGTHAKCEIGGNYFFLGGPKEGSVSVYALGTGEVQDLGSREANKIINKYNEEHLATAVLEARVIDDYQYLILHLPEDCIMINLKVAKEVGKEYAWSILKTDVLGNTPWRAIHGVFDPQIGQYVYGDQWDERIGILDMSVATHYNEVVECILYTPFVYLESMSIDQLEIFIIPGFTTPNYPRVQPPPPPPPVVGNLYTFGSGSEGELGDNSTTSKSSPVLIGSALYLGAGGGYQISGAIREDGSLWTWGNNGFGALGVGDTDNRSSPVQVGARLDWSDVSFGANNTMLALTSTGEMYSAGRGDFGQLGLGDLVSRSSPTQIAGSWRDCSMGTANSYAIASNRSLWGWGDKTLGALCGPQGTFPYIQSTPVQIAAGNDWAWVSAGRNSGVAAKTNGEVYVWGYNSTGQLGLGDTTNRSSPVLLVGDWTKVVSAGNTGSIGNMYGIKSDGTLWGWGENGKGQLGQGDTTDRSSPVQISDFTDWTDIAANGEKWIGIRENGQAWGCGDGSLGQLDNYSTTNYSSPVQVAFVDTALIPACGYDHSLLIYRDPFL